MTSLDATPIAPPTLPVARWKVHVALMMVAIIYGGWVILAHEALSHEPIAPLAMALYRCLGGGAVIMVFNACTSNNSKQRNDPRDHWPRLMLLGLLQSCNLGGNICALNELPALTVSIFQPMLPIFGGIFAALLGIEHIALLQWSGILAVVIGAVVVVAFGSTPQSTEEPRDGSVFRGVTLLMINLCGGALYNVLQKDVLRVLPPALVAGVAQLVAACILFVVALLTKGQWSDFSLDNHLTLYVACYGSLLTTGYNYTALAWANRETTPTLVLCYLPLQCVFAALFSTIFLAVLPSVWQVGGGILILMGLVVFICTASSASPEPLQTQHQQSTYGGTSKKV